jgi:hypothetical protein
MALHAAQKTERQSMPRVVVSAAGRLIYRVRDAVARLLSRMPGLRSVLAHITGDPELGLARRHELEEQALAGRHAGERAMLEREKRSMAAVEAREERALAQALRRKITDSDTQSPSLFVPPRHEDEDMHRLHDRLVFERERLLWERGLSPTFNRNAGLEKKQDEDERARRHLLTAFARAAADGGDEGKSGDRGGGAEAPAPDWQAAGHRADRADHEDDFERHEREHEAMLREEIARNRHEYDDDDDDDHDHDRHHHHERRHKPKPRRRRRPKPDLKRRR